jgi:hypothetical protein
MNQRLTITIATGIAALTAALAVSAVIAARPGPQTTTGSGTVFLPNPVADLEDQSLTDEKDRDYAALGPAYHNVVLTNLDGSGFLRGDWVTIRSETADPAYSPTNTFQYDRHDDRFEQVMAYYWITEAQKYIQGLGFGSSHRPVNMTSQRVRINQWGVDNSLADEKKFEIRLGKGGVDDAEDAEVILHEYGHAMHFSQSPTFYTSNEAGAIGEGFGDYWAVTVSNVIAPTADTPCVADWDAVSYTTGVPHCLRRVDLDLHYPEDLDGRVHHDGMIWSRALWDIRLSLGNAKADTIILEAQFDFPGTTMPDLAQLTVEAAQSLYGNSEAGAVEDAFQARGILP